MAYRNKIYVAFDGDNDISYYRMMLAWKANPNDDFSFNNAHDLHTARDSSNEASIKASLRDRFANSKMFILLIGEHTKYLTKFVKWEIETALRLNLPIVAVNLNGHRNVDEFCPPVLRDELSIFIPFKENIIKYAIGNWPESDKNHRSKGEISNYHYIDSVYTSL
ncbi:TIR domain-containing protein [Companilactobacillus muriivasis]|uniref:TIR domain-containing protein n=1 Tax=Companilactobacillus muriivasis TaxID=3081444 RepID=UPI0030C66606